MSLGRREAEQSPLWVATQELPRSAGHPFYARLEGLLREAEFDRRVEDMCAPHYKDGGRPSIPPGVYFRMLFVGYFEGIDSQRGIAWRCSDSIALREFLGVPITRSTPDHSSLTVIRQRLPLAVHEAVFTLVLALAAEKGLLKGKTIAVDATLLEANAAMKSIVRRDTGEDWKGYLRRLATDEGEESTKDDDLRRFDKRRKKKKVSNKDWGSPSDPDSRIARMKDGTTHLAYKAEHAVDLDSNLVVAAPVYHATEADPTTLLSTIDTARQRLAEAADVELREVVTDRGYHKLDNLVACEERGLRSYVCEPKINGERRWDDKTAEQRAAFQRNHRRVRGERSKALQRLRSERAERSFAHVCETGGARRTWIRGLEEVAKRYLVQVAGHNLGVLLRAIFGVGTPRALQGKAAELAAALTWCLSALAALFALVALAMRSMASVVMGDPAMRGGWSHSELRWQPISTGC